MARRRHRAHPRCTRTDVPLFGAHHRTRPDTSARTSPRPSSATSTSTTPTHITPTYRIIAWRAVPHPPDRVKGHGWGEIRPAPGTAVLAPRPLDGGHEMSVLATRLVEVTSHVRAASPHRSCVRAGHGLCVGHCMGHAPTHAVNSGDIRPARRRSRGRVRHPEARMPQTDALRIFRSHRPTRSPNSLAVCQTSIRGARCPCGQRSQWIYQGGPPRLCKSSVCSMWCTSLASCSATAPPPTSSRSRSRVRHPGPPDSASQSVRASSSSLANERDLVTAIAIDTGSPASSRRAFAPSE